MTGVETGAGNIDGIGGMLGWGEEDCYEASSNEWPYILGWERSLQEDENWNDREECVSKRVDQLDA